MESKTSRGHVALITQGSLDGSLIPILWGWVGEGDVHPGVLESRCPFFQGHVPLPWCVQLALQTQLPSSRRAPLCTDLRAPTWGRPLG